MSECFLGEIRMFAGTYAPQNWSFCDGSTLSISQYEALYTLIGTTYGGNGTTTFNLPDLRGRVPIGQGAGLGLTPRTLAQAVGAEEVTLTTVNLPAHSHGLQVSQNAATAITPNGNVPAVPPTVISHNYAMYTVAHPSAPPVATDLAPMIKPSGSNLPHENMMPGLCISYIIALAGIFPTQN